MPKGIDCQCAVPLPLQVRSQLTFLTSDSSPSPGPRNRTEVASIVKNKGVDGLLDTLRKHVQ